MNLFVANTWMDWSKENELFRRQGWSESQDARTQVDFEDTTLESPAHDPPRRTL